MIQPPPGQRKYRAFLVVLALYTCVVVLGHVPAEHVAGGYYTLAGFYFAGNVGEHWTKRGEQ